jgi:uncharacterized radical SAM protein YgiQ
LKETTFLPTTANEMKESGWDDVDFVYVSGDAYVDHPSFGAAVISRVLESEGFRVAMLCQPDYKSAADFKRFGKPRLGFLVSAGNIDSMVAHYTVFKKKRSFDYYSPGGKAGLRPDRAVIVYCNRIREAYGDIPIIIGGLEASLRRFAHYDYWQNAVRRSILVDSRADILSYGMGEHSITEVAKLLAKGARIKKIRDVRGTCYIADAADKPFFDYETLPDYDTIKTNKVTYANSFRIQYMNLDHIYGKALVEGYGNKILVQNPPCAPLTEKELDRVYSLPYVRTFHPSYTEGVPAIEEVKFSITHVRGCFGECNFCALTFHQGRAVSSRSHESVLSEAEKITAMPDFKGYIHDVGGPTANFRAPACTKQAEFGVCKNRRCLAPTPCQNLIADHSDYLSLLNKLRALPRMKKVFIRSGIRYDYLMLDKNEEFFDSLVQNHISGQLKVAPEHASGCVLDTMGKPSFDIYRKFKAKYFEKCKAIGKEQYLVPYLMSSHPGSTIESAIELAQILKEERISPEQVQDFYPTPGTVSTVMYYTHIDPLTGKPVYVADTYEEKAMQRALLQSGRRENARLVREALIKAGRRDLIGSSPKCLIRNEYGIQRAYRGGEKRKK